MLNAQHVLRKCHWLCYVVMEFVLIKIEPIKQSFEPMNFEEAVFDFLNKLDTDYYALEEEENLETLLGEYLRSNATLPSLLN